MLSCESCWSDPHLGLVLSLEVTAAHTALLLERPAVLEDDDAGVPELAGPVAVTPVQLAHTLVVSEAGEAAVGVPPAESEGRQGGEEEEGETHGEE